MLLAKLNRDREYLYLMDDYKDEKYSLADLIRIGKKYNTDLEGFYIKDMEEFTHEKRNIPFILLLDDERRNHMVYVNKRKYGKVYIADPDLGTYTQEIKTFKDSCYIGVCVKKHHRHKSPRTKQRFLFSYEKFLLAIFRILCVVGTFVTMAFMSTNFYFPVPLFLLLMSIASELGFRLFSMIVFKNIDERILLCSRVDKDHFYDYIKYTNLYKTQAITNSSNIFFSVIISGFIIYIGIMNDLLNLIPMFICVFATIIHTIIYSSKDELDKYEVEKFERDVERSKTYRKFATSYNSMVDKALHNTYKGGVHIVVVGCILLVSILINMYLNHINDISYVIFYLFSFVVLYEEMNKIATFKEAHTREQKTLLKILSLTQ